MIQEGCTMASNFIGLWFLWVFYNMFMRFFYSFVFVCLCACVIMWIDMQRARKGMTSLVSVLKIPWYKEQFGMFFPPGFRVSRSYCLKWSMSLFCHIFPFFCPGWCYLKSFQRFGEEEWGWVFVRRQRCFAAFFLGGGRSFPFWGQKAFFSGKNLLLVLGKVYNLNRTGPTFE